MHVDGFRFDEGSILTRGEDGETMDHPPVIWQIELSETLADTKIIAEAWDAAGPTRSAISRGTAGPSGTAVTANDAAASSRAIRG